VPKKSISPIAILADASNRDLNGKPVQVLLITATNVKILRCECDWYYHVNTTIIAHDHSRLGFRNAFPHTTVVDGRATA